jgi:hypothetical protein
MAEMGAPLDQFREVETGEAFTLQNKRLLKVELSATSVMAKNGAMVAYQGDVHFEHKGGGLGRMLKKAASTSPATDLSRWCPTASPCGSTSRKPRPSATRRRQSPGRAG